MGIKLSAPSADLFARDTANRNRANHTGTQPWNTITGTPTTLAGYGITDPIPYSVIVACSGTSQALTAGTARETFRVERAFTLSGVRASLTTAATGSTVIVDINLNGVSVLGTKLSIDASELTSVTAASAATIVTSAIPSDGQITIDIDQVGATTPGTGLKVVLLGTLV